MSEIEEVGAQGVRDREEFQDVGPGEEQGLTWL